MINFLSKQVLIDYLHLFVLTGFAVAQPIYDLLGRNPEFFVAHRAGPLLITALVVLLSFGLPAALCLLESSVLFLGERIRRSLHIVFMAVLALLALLPVAGRLVDGADLAVLGIAMTMSLAFTVLYIRWHIMGLLLTFLIPVVLIFPLWFLFMTPVERLVISQPEEEFVDSEIENPAPVVLVVLDELSTVSLLDESGHINTEMFPNLADFAEHSYWFPNAIAPHVQTMHAIPSILTGKQPRPEAGLSPTAADYPENLFTLLGKYYEINALEAQTALFPESLRDEGKNYRHRTDTGSFFADIWIIYQHIVSPAERIQRLPTLDGQWTGFGRKRTGELKRDAKPNGHKAGRAEHFQVFIDGIKNDKNEQLHFLHILLPHVPYEYLASGHSYVSESRNHPFPAGIRNESEGWSSHEDLIRVSYNQYLQQIGFTDLLLGRMFHKLKEKDLYDSSLIILTSDHGVSFRPGYSRRGVVSETKLDILKVPMFIKLPGQDKGVIQENLVSGIDILPTIADVLGVKMFWDADGVSMFSDHESRSEIQLPNVGTFSAEELTGFPNLQRHISCVKNCTSQDQAKEYYPFPDLMGRDIWELSPGQEKSMKFFSEIITHFENVDPEDTFIPALFYGYITGTEELNLSLAIAVNDRILKTTTTSQWLEFDRYFVTLLPFEAFNAGRNRIEIFLIRETETGIRLLRIPYLYEKIKASTIVKYPGGKEKLLLNDSEEIVISEQPEELQGFVDVITRKGDKILIRGWARDSSYQPVDSILVFAGNELLSVTMPGIKRQDVADHFNRESMLFSGFQLEVFFNFRKMNMNDIRLIAVTRDMAAFVLK